MGVMKKEYGFCFRPMGHKSVTIEYLMSLLSLRLWYARSMCTSLVSNLKGRVRHELVPFMEPSPIFNRPPMQLQHVDEEDKVFLSCQENELMYL